MERKIGEIFEFESEWYQTVKSQGKCCSCDFMIDGHCIVDFSSNGSCFYCHRKDKENVIFKKLEKVGEPIEFARGLYFQRYRLAYSTAFYEGDTRLFFNAPTKTFVYIEIKQNKEDMEEKKLNLKPFDIQKAKEGKPVCTRDGRKARIICFDRNSIQPIIALIKNFNGEESVNVFFKDGHSLSKNNEVEADLMMLTEKKEGWVNVYYDNDASSHRGCRFIYDTKEQAVKEAGSAYIDTIKISWSE